MCRCDDSSATKNQTNLLLSHNFRFSDNHPLPLYFFIPLLQPFFLHFTSPPLTANLLPLFHFTPLMPPTIFPYSTSPSSLLTFFPCSTSPLSYHSSSSNPLHSLLPLTFFPFSNSSCSQHHPSSSTQL